VSHNPAIIDTSKFCLDEKSGNAATCRVAARAKFFFMSGADCRILPPQRRGRRLRQKGLATISHVAATSGTVDISPQNSQRRLSAR
jgi:hypothetical protein